MGKLLDQLIPELKVRFPNRGLRIEQDPPKRAVFPAAHPEVGDLIIEDDEEELTVIFGNFTHCHYGPFQLSRGATEPDFIESLLLDLDDLFSDRIVMWGSHEKGGGLDRGGEDEAMPFEPHGLRYVWSGPYDQ